MINIHQDNLSDWRRLAPRCYERTQADVGVGEPIVPVAIPRNKILVGDATEKLKTLPSASVDCVITSPPYWNLRDYHAEGQIGLEESLDAWVASLRSVFAEVARVLKPGGGLWLNIGDTFSPSAKVGVPAKGMVCAPERLLLALADSGWLVRSKVIWSKEFHAQRCGRPAERHLRAPLLPGPFSSVLLQPERDPRTEGRDAKAPGECPPRRRWHVARRGPR